MRRSLRVINTSQPCLVVRKFPCTFCSYKKLKNYTWIHTYIHTYIHIYIYTHYLSTIHERSPCSNSQTQHPQSQQATLCCLRPNQEKPASKPGRIRASDREAPCQTCLVDLSRPNPQQVLSFGAPVLAPPPPHTPSMSHFARRVKLRLAYRLAFVIYKYITWVTVNLWKEIPGNKAILVKWRFFVQSLKKPLACSISWNVKLHRVACSPDRRIAFITEVPNTVQAVASHHYMLSKSWNNVLDSRL